MKCNWEDLPKPLNCFTVMNTAMINLNTGKAVRHYSTNTKIVVVQKCVTPKGTYYRTAEAEHYYLNYAFEASAFGLPNEVAPSEHSLKLDSSTCSDNKPDKRAQKPAKKQKSIQKTATPKDGEGKQRRSWLKRIFRRKNGKAKNS